MGISTYNITALRVFAPISILDRTLEFFEFLRYETKSIRNNPVLLKEEIFDIISKSTKIKQVSKIKKSEI